MSSELAMRSDEFDITFEEKFGLKKKGYTKDNILFAQAAMSNMIGEVVCLLFLLLPEYI